MQSPYPPRPPFPPRPGASPGESDRDLVASLGEDGAGPRAVALLMARHWRATHDYAAICLATTESSAPMVAAAAFQRVLRRPAPGALRPQLLVAVRDMVKEWAADDGISALLPELGKPTGGRGLRAARPTTPERRQIAERAFRALSGASQCLLWHAEVEAEPITIPAGLLGVDTPTASAALEGVREQFRRGCVRAHGELAPSRECRYYNRLLDVPIRRGGALLPDVQQHLMECRYCRHAAEQLSHFEGGLEVLLAETVLGWGARRYLDSRPGRGGSSACDRRRRGGRHRPERLTPPRARGRAVAVGVGLTSLVLLVTVLTAKGWSDENGVPDAHATWGVAGGSTVDPGTVSEPSSGGTPSAASAEDPVEIAQGRLRNLDGGLCLDLRAGRVRTGAPAELTECSNAASQQWSYQDNGVLRSAVDPTLCLDSDPDGDAGKVVLASCLAHAGETRYDLTVHGELLLRRAERLAVAHGKGGSVIVAERDGSEAQRWMLDGGLADVGGKETRDKGLQQGDEEGRGDKKGDEEGRGDKKEQDVAPVEPDRGSPHDPIPVLPGAEPGQDGPDPSAEPAPSRYETRYVQADSGDGATAVATLPAQVTDTVTPVVGTAATLLDSALP
ncbi:RICIN domain-containing protein [Streptomyces sp. KS_5]|uniref:RICIN domain-containing protein n=1 Tax=Streptomyces TaxID=1883 RepID=UPI00068F5163|nr:RICIN domain-containing protein [Streptomyces sp. KS_5]SED89781.1 Ricin-type beta-trefoil lectin domain-containing protein [Streptomyces sp. KS_5]